MKKDIVKKVLDFYLKSRDFNGLPLIDFIKEFDSIEEAKLELENLIKNNIVDLYTCNTNPHVKNFDCSLRKDLQLECLKNLPDEYKEEYEEINNIIRIIKPSDFSNSCLYPTKELLEKELGCKKEYLEMPPFEKMLAFGSPQLKFVYFRIDVLDRYLNDPRYQIRYGDYYGDIHSLEEDEYDHPEDSTYLKHFGLAYNKNTNENLICAFVYDLHKCSPRHQFHFYSHIIDEDKDCYPDSDFYRNSILGTWAEKSSIFDAILEEIKVINSMTMFICSKKLFKKEFHIEPTERPEYFHSFLKPTKIEYSNFCRTLNKIFVDNLNKECLLAIDILNGEKLSNKQKKANVLTLLETFLNTYFKACDGEQTGTLVVKCWEETIKKIRNTVSHEFITNSYDKNLFGEYAKTLNEAYESIRLLRLIMTNHPKVRFNIKANNINIPEWLYKGEIRNYFRKSKKEN